MTAPIVDVGIPTRNRPEYLGAAVSSVLAQTLRSFTLIVSENGAGNAAVAAALKEFLTDERVRHVVQGRDLGAAGNYSGIVRSGTAPYVAILHDDDRWDPAFLERRIEFLEEHPTCGLVFSGCTVIDDSGAIIDVWEPEVKPGLHTPRDFLPVLYERNVIPVPTVVVRRAAYEAVGADFDRSLVFDDHNMWLRIASRFDVGCLSAIDAAYRVHGEQTSSHQALRFGEHRLQFLDAADDLVGNRLPGSIRRGARADAHLWAAFDAYERGEHRLALSHIVRAAASPMALAHRRGLGFRRASLVTAASLLGSSGRNTWSARREYGRRRTRAAAARRVAHAFPQVAEGVPEFSVLIAARGSEETLRETLESVSMQTDRSFEIVVVAAGPEGATLEIPASFAGRLRVLPRPPGSLGAALNAGIAEARGRFVSVLGANDLWLPEYLASTRRALNAEPAPALVFTDAWALDEAAGRIRRRLLTAPRRPADADPHALLRLLLDESFVRTAATLRREAVLAVGGYDERLDSACDYELWLRLAARGYAAASVEAPLAVHRLGGGSHDIDSAANARVYAAVAGEYDLPEDLRALARRREREARGAADMQRRGRTVRIRPRGRRFLRQTPPEVAGAFPSLVKHSLWQRLI